MPHDIFISYASKDKPTADALCATLEGKGLRCWIAPRDVMPGADWSEAIIDAINGSRALVLVYSDHANTSPQIRREVERAVHKGIAVVPLRIEDVPMSKALEYFISTPHWLDALTPPLQRHLDYLAETLKRFVDPPHDPPPPVPSSLPPASPVFDVPFPAPTPKAPVLPPPVPPPALDRRMLVAVVGLVAVLLVIAVAYFLKSSDGGGFVPGADTLSPASVQRELVGSWITQTTVNGLPVDVEIWIGRDGLSRSTTTLRDQGRFDSGRGRWSMVNTAGQTTTGTYKFLSDGVMSMAGPFGTAAWTRDPASPPDRSGRLSGTWSTSGTAPDGRLATSTLVFGSDGRYEFITRAEDTGAKLEASDGRWRSVSATTNRVTEGTYQLTGSDSLTWGAPTGALTFKRRQ